MIKYLENNNLNELIKEGITLVDFYADWCGPCRMQAPIVEQLSEKYQNIKVLKVNTDNNPDISNLFRIRSIPTLVLIKDNSIIKQEAGFKTLSQLEEWIEEK